MNVEVPVTIHIHQRSQPVVADALVDDWQLATDEVVAELEVGGNITHSPTTAMPRSQKIGCGA